MCLCLCACVFFFVCVRAFFVCMCACACLLVSVRVLQLPLSEHFADACINGDAGFGTRQRIALFSLLLDVVAQSGDAILKLHCYFLFLSRCKCSVQGYSLVVLNSQPHAIERTTGEDGRVARAVSPAVHSI